MTVCTKAACRGMVITDGKVRQVGDLRAVSAAVVLVDCGAATYPWVLDLNPLVRRRLVRALS